MSALARWLLLRRLLLQRGRTWLTTLGVALGVAVFVSIRLANRSALASFSDTVDAVTGRANLTVQSASDGFDERWYARIARHPGVVAAAPVVQVAALARAGGPGAWRAARGGAESMTFLGIDPLVEGPFVRFEAATAPPAGAWAGSLRLLAEPGTVAITRALAARDRIGVNDTLSVLVSGRPTPLVVAQVLDTGPLQQAMGGQFALVDIATAQEVFARPGRIDRVDLIVPARDRDRIGRELAASLPADLAVELPQSRSRQVENMVAAFQLNLTALSFIALLVSMFLIFNAVAMSVLRWRREIGILRSLGATRGQVLRLFVLEGMLLGGAGSALGLLLGAYLARFTLAAVGRTLTDLYLVHHTDVVRVDPATCAMGLGLGIAVAMLSALAPAVEASYTAPGLTMRQGMLLEAQRLPIGRWTAGGFLALALAGLVVAWTVREQQPWGGFVAAFLVVAGFSMLAPAFTLAGGMLARRPAEALGGIAGALGARALREFLARTSVVVASLMLAVGMTVALSIMVGSFRRTVDTWITQTIRGDLYIEPAGHRTSGSATSLPAFTVSEARRLPGVLAVDTYRATWMRYGGRQARVMGVEFDVQRRFGHLAFVDGRDSRAVLAEAIATGGAVVTESFSHRFHVGTGDTVILPAPTGPARVRVAGVFYDYSTDAGAVFVDRRTFARAWGADRTEGMALYCAPGTDLAAVRRAFLERAAQGRVYVVTPNQDLRRRVLAVFDQTFRITFALQFIAVAIAVLGVVTTLTALILQRGREIGVLRATGALRSQVRSMVLIESGILGLLGGLLGCAAGYVLALLLVNVINRQFFGWTIRMHVEPGVFVQAVLLMVVTAVVAGIGPARHASDRIAAEAMRVES